MFRGIFLISAFLFSLSTALAAEASSQWGDFLDPASIPALTLQYQTITQKQETLSHHGLVSLQQQLDGDKKLRRLGETMVSSIVQFQTDRGAERVRRAARNHRELGKPVPTAIIGALIVVSTGAPFDLFKSDSTRLTARSRISDKKSQLDLKTPLLDGSVEITSKATAGEDRCKLRIQRQIPALQATGGLTYGSTAATIVASLNKQLTPHWSAAVASSRAVGGRDQPEGSFRLHYEIQF